MVNYLAFFPRPLLVDMCEGQVLPFVGAGFSLNAEVPPGRREPTITDIANCLNELMPEYMGNSTQDVLSEFDIRFGRAQFAEELYKILLIGVARPGTAHLAFARLPFDTVVTTNIDQLLEEAYLQVGRFPQVIMFEEQLPVKDTADDPVQLLKIHGDINFPDRMIWTEEDYDTFVGRFPLLVTYLAALLIDHTPLFIGYSVEDYDLRQIWNIIGLRLGRLRRLAYVIEVNAPPSLVARYARRGIEVINLPGERANFNQILTDAFTQLREFLRTGCPPPGLPPCDTLGQGIDVGAAPAPGSAAGTTPIASRGTAARRPNRSQAPGSAATTQQTGVAGSRGTRQRTRSARQGRGARRARAGSSEGAGRRRLRASRRPNGSGQPEGSG